MRMKQQDQLKIQPITLSLIQKYSFTRPLKGQVEDNESMTQASSNNSDTNSIMSDEPHMPQDHQNAEKMIYLKTIRLGFLNLGPNIENLEIFEHLFSLYLQHNKISNIGQGLKMNINLQFIALQNNLISKVEGIKHLKNLNFLELSNNLIEDFDVTEFPKNIMILKMNDNPCTSKKVDYRKQLVLHLNELEELDKIKVIPAERLAYQGLIVKVDVNKMLEKFKKERKHQDAQERMEKEMFIEYMMEKGSDTQTRLLKSLEEFAKFEEFEELQKQFSQIMLVSKEKSQEEKENRQHVQEKIDVQVNEVMNKYGKQQ